MFLEVEGHVLVNLDLVQAVEMDHQRKTANILNGSCRLISDSSILYRYYRAIDLESAPAELPKD